MSGLFVTGTDTGVGKTLVSLGLMALLQERGSSVLGFKPVASGSQPGPLGPRNADALRLQAQGSGAQPYARINPYAFVPPIAPHLAAEQAGVAISGALIAACYRQLHDAADWVIVEGVGGWRVPLSDTLAVGDLPRLLELPVVLVVGLRLGCLNHALLSAERIRADGPRLVGWVASTPDAGMLEIDANLRALRERLPAPCLGVVPWLATPAASDIAARLDLDALPMLD